MVPDSLSYKVVVRAALKTEILKSRHAFMIELKDICTLQGRFPIPVGQLPRF